MSLGRFEYIAEYRQVQDESLSFLLEPPLIFRNVFE